MLFVQTLLQDLGYALRQLRKRPGYSAIAIGVLALGLGSNAAIFSVVNAVLLQPLPYAHPDRLTALFERNVVGEELFNEVAPGNFLDWRRDARSFDQIAASSEARFNLASNGASLPEHVDGATCSANLFATLGVSPILGRTFREAEDRPGAPLVAIISYGLWQRRFGGSQDTIHRQIRLDSQNYDIVGVMPADFGYPSWTVQAWVPMQRALLADTLKSHGYHFLSVVGRLKAGVSVGEARAEIDGMARRFKREHPEEISGRGGNVVALAENAVKNVRTSLLVLFAAVGCVLLIACVNVANLLLARSLGRQREVAIRAAIGASRARIIRQLLTESVLLSFLGAIAGLLLAAFATPELASRAPNANYLPQVQNIHLDGAVFLFTFGAALVSGMVAGLFPALQSSQADLVTGLKETSRSATAGGSHRRFQDALVTLEVALSLVLLVSAGLLLRSFAELQNVRPGVRTDHVLTMAIALPRTAYDKAAKGEAFYEQLSDRLRTIPGVRSVGLVTCPPVGGHCGDWVFDIDGHPAPPGQMRDALSRGASADYFAAAGIPLLEGRTFEPQDGVGDDPAHPRLGAMVISESLAKRYLPNEDPIGKRIGFTSDSRHARWQVVGVVGDVLQRPDAKVTPAVYVPLGDDVWSQVTAVIHTSVEPHSVAAAAREEVARLNADLPVSKFAPWMKSSARGRRTGSLA